MLAQTIKESASCSNIIYRFGSKTIDFLSSIDKYYKRMAHAKSKQLRKENESKKFNK